MSADGRRLLDLLVDVPAQAAERERREAARWSFATATEGGLVLDGDAEPMTDPPASTVEYAVGDQVVVLKGGGRMVIVGNATATGRYEPHLSLYTPPGYSHARWRNRVHAAKHGRSTKVAVVGSSSVAGFGGTSIRDGWAWQLRHRFADAGYPIQGTGLMHVGAAKMSADPQWSFSATGVTAPSAALHGSITSGAWAKATTDVPGSFVRVWYLNNGGPFTVTINDRAPVTITPDGTQTAASWLSPLLGLGLHDVTLTATGTTNALVVAVEAFDPTNPGIAVTAAGIATSTTAGWSTWFWSSNTPNAIRGQAAATLVAVNGNDFSYPVDRGVTRDRLARIVRGLRNLASEPILVRMPVSAWQDRAGYAAHSQVLYDVANAEKVALIDMLDRWGTYHNAEAAGFFHSDGVHPSTRGHAAYADAIFDVIGA